MRIIFMGTPQFAVPALTRLIESAHEVALVATQPDRPAGRGKQPQASAVKECALAHGLRVEQPASLKRTAFHEVMAGVEPDVAVVAAYGLILPPATLQAPRHGCLNIHASLLPRWRGAAPIQRAMMAGDRKTGVTIMQMDEGLDTGDIIDQREVDILPDDDALSLTNALAVIGADLLIETLERLENEGALAGRRQEEAMATMAPKIARDEGRIDWTHDGDAIICRIHALRRWPKTYTEYGQTTLRIIDAEPELITPELSNADDPPGTVVALIKNRGPIVRCGDGFLALTKVQPESRKPMSGGAWVNGGGAKIGDRLGAPAKDRTPSSDEPV